MASLGRFDLVVVGVAASLLLSGCGGVKNLMGHKSTTLAGSLCNKHIMQYLLPVMKDAEADGTKLCAQNIQDWKEEEEHGEEEEEKKKVSWKALNESCVKAVATCVDQSEDGQLATFTKDCERKFSKTPFTISDEKKLHPYLEDENVQRKLKRAVNQAAEIALSKFDDANKPKNTRLYDSGIRSVRSVGIGSVALACVIGSMLAGVVGLVAVFRRSYRQPWDSLIDSEEPEEARA